MRYIGTKGKLCNLVRCDHFCVYSVFIYATVVSRSRGSLKFIAIESGASPLGSRLLARKWVELT